MILRPQLSVSTSAVRGTDATGQVPATRNVLQNFSLIAEIPDPGRDQHCQQFRAPNVEHTLQMHTWDDNKLQSHRDAQPRSPHRDMGSFKPSRICRIECVVRRDLAGRYEKHQTFQSTSCTFRPPASPLSSLPTRSKPARQDAWTDKTRVPEKPRKTPVH